MADSRRPVLISVMQYEDELNSGALAVGDVIAAAARLGGGRPGIRPQYWREKERELLPRAMPSPDTACSSPTPRRPPSSAPTRRMARACGRRSPIRGRSGRRNCGSSSARAPEDDDTDGWAAGQALTDYAAEQGITLALENYAWTPGGTIAELARTLDRLPALAVNLDIGNYPRHGEDVLDAIRLFGSRAVSAHLKDQHGPPDWQSHPLGGGSLPLPRIMAALEALPQHLIYCFEFRGGGDPTGRIARSLEYLRDREWDR